MESRRSAEEEPQPDPAPVEGSSKNKKRKRGSRRRRLPEDELKLLNDLSDYPHLAAMFEAEAILRTEQKREKMSEAENNAAETGSLPLTDGKEQQEKLRLLESIAKMCCWMIEKMENNNGNNEEPKANGRKKKRRKSLPDDELKLLNDLSGLPHLATIFQAHTVLGARKALKKKMMNSHVMSSCEIRSQPQTIGDSKVEEQQEEFKSSESIAHMSERKTEIMENDNGNNEEERSGKRKKERKRIPDDGLKMLDELSSFPHLATIFRAVPVLRERKELRRENMYNPETNPTENAPRSQNTTAALREDTVEGTYELLQMHMDTDTLEVISHRSSSAGNVVVTNFSGSGSIGQLISPSGDLVTEKQEEKSSPDECDGTTEDALLPLAGDILPMKLLVDAGDRDACREVSRSVSIESKLAINEENIVLRKLLRKWRYFDSGDEKFHLEGHAVKSASKNQRKKCYVCGDVQHTGNKCRKRRTCYFCHERGHLAEDCPKSSQEYNMCLRCGESGHDLFSCNNDYPPDDLNNIVCYICNKGGHICCRTYTSINPDTVSCYNCGESGHSGMQCPKPHMDKKSSRPPSLCYKCGEEGHAARKCRVPLQNKRQQSEG